MLIKCLLVNIDHIASWLEWIASFEYHYEFELMIIDQILD